MKTQYQPDKGIEQKSGTGYQTKQSSSTSVSTDQKLQGNSAGKRQRHILSKLDEDRVLSTLELVQQDARRSKSCYDFWGRVTPKGTRLVRIFRVDPDESAAENRRTWERE